MGVNLSSYAFIEERKVTESLILQKFKTLKKPLPEDILDSFQELLLIYEKDKPFLIEKYTSEIVNAFDTELTITVIAQLELWEDSTPNSEHEIFRRKNIINEIKNNLSNVEVMLQRKQQEFVSNIRNMHNELRVTLQGIYGIKYLEEYDSAVKPTMKTLLVEFNPNSSYDAACRHFQELLAIRNAFREPIDAFDAGILKKKLASKLPTYEIQCNPVSEFLIKFKEDTDSRPARKFVFNKMRAFLEQVREASNKLETPLDLSETKKIASKVQSLADDFFILEGYFEEAAEIIQMTLKDLLSDSEALSITSGDNESFKNIKKLLMKVIFEDEEQLKETLLGFKNTVSKQTPLQPYELVPILETLKDCLEMQIEIQKKMNEIEQLVQTLSLKDKPKILQWLTNRGLTKTALQNKWSLSGPFEKLQSASESLSRDLETKDRVYQVSLQSLELIKNNETLLTLPTFILEFWTQLNKKMSSK